MTTIDLDSVRKRRALAELKSARRARDELDLPRQRECARAAADVAERLQGEDGAGLFAYALDAEVDALLNMNDITRAYVRADVGERHVRNVAHKSPAYATASRVAATTLELSGQAENAMRRFMGLEAELRQHRTDTRRERLRCLQHALSAAKRTPLDCKHAMTFLLAARRMGDTLAEEIEGLYPEDVAYYRHWAGCSEMWLAERGSGNPDRAVELLASSLVGRSDTLRDFKTRDMGRAERMLAEGYRDDAIETFDECVTSMADDLPRHAASARRMLARRGLRAA